MQCAVSGSGVSDGGDRDRHDFEISTEESEVSLVEVRGQFGTRCKVVMDSDNRGGHFEAVEPGKYTISVTFTKTIILTKAQCSVSGTAVQGGDARKDAVFFVDTGISVGGNEPAIQIEVLDPKGESVAIAELVDHEDGTYTGGEFHPNIKGQYKVSVKVWGEPVSGSPFAPVFEAASRERSFASGPGVEGGGKARVGRVMAFTIHSRDQSGDPLKEGGEPFKVLVKSPKGTEPATVEDNNDGTYTVTYTPEVAGSYQVDISLHDKPLSVCPYKLTILDDREARPRKLKDTRARPSSSRSPVRKARRGDSSDDSRTSSPSRARRKSRSASSSARSNDSPAPAA
eukprot:RCo035697